MARYKVVVTDDRHGGCEIERGILAGADAELIVADCATISDVIDASSDADGVLCNLAPMPVEVIEHLAKCRVISRYGVGYDNVDASACTGKRIYLANVPDYCTEEVSDHALALLLACARNVVGRDAQVRAGLWNTNRNDPVHRIAGKTFALLGYGKIAQCLHRKIRGLEPGRVLIYDPYQEDGVLTQAGGEKVGWEAALSDADFISVHMPLNNETRGKIDRSAFGLMKRTVILVNTSRGAIIDEEALIEALTRKDIRSAGLDTFQTEPISADNPLLKLNNCVLSDHVGFYSQESQEELKRKAAENVLDVLNGSAPRYWANKFE